MITNITKASGEFTFTTNRGYVETVAPNFAKAPNKKTFPNDKRMFTIYVPRLNISQMTDITKLDCLK
jgi:hypothetical protein